MAGMGRLGRGDGALARRARLHRRQLRRGRGRPRRAAPHHLADPQAPEHRARRRRPRRGDGGRRRLRVVPLRGLPTPGRGDHPGRPVAPDRADQRRGPLHVGQPGRPVERRRLCARRQRPDPLERAHLGRRRGARPGDRSDGQHHGGSERRRAAHRAGRQRRRAQHLARRHADRRPDHRAQRRGATVRAVAAPERGKRPGDRRRAADRRGVGHHGQAAQAHRVRRRHRRLQRLLAGRRRDGRDSGGHRPPRRPVRPGDPQAVARPHHRRRDRGHRTGVE